MATAAQIGDAMRRHVEEACVEIAINVTAELVERTPVDTGFARASWIPTIGSPASAADGSGAAQAAGLAAIIAFNLTQGSLFSSNFARYIKRLNAGSSTQAPAGFVEAAIDRTIAETGGAS